MGVFLSWPRMAQAAFATCIRAPSTHELFHPHTDAGMQPAEPVNGNTGSAGLPDRYQRAQDVYFSTQIKLHLCPPDSISLLLVSPRCDGHWAVAERRKEGKGNPDTTSRATWQCHPGTRAPTPRLLGDIPIPLLCSDHP